MKQTSLRSLVAGLAVILLPASVLSQELQGDPAAGQKKIANCIGCHGIPGYQASFPEVYRVPKISQQNAKYIAGALQAYKAGERRHPTMRSIAQTLSDQDIADVAAYYERHGEKVALAEQLPAPPAPVAELIAKGGCVGCHGANFSKPVDAGYPKLAGQNRDYLFVALKSYQGEVHPTWGRANPIMAGMTKQYSRAELKAIANYIGDLPGELQVVPQPRFR